MSSPLKSAESDGSHRSPSSEGVAGAGAEVRAGGGDAEREHGSGAPPASDPARRRTDDDAPPKTSARWVPALTRLPQPHQILSWIYSARLVATAAVFVSVVWVWQQASPTLTLAASLIVVVSGAATAASFWYTHLLERTPGRNFLYIQSIFDVVLVTAIVHLTGGQNSPFAPLYILVICAAAILLPFLGGILVALLASVLYMAEVVWNSQGHLDGTVPLQLALFTIVALVTGYVGDRLRQTGTALGRVETELQLLKLDTDEILGTINTGILTVDGQGRLAYINPTAADLLALSEREWLGRPVIRSLDEAAPGLGWVIERTQRERQPIARFETGDLVQGSFVLGVSTTLLERTDTGGPAVTAIFQDITEKRRFELLERRAERLEAIAELSASLAHEIKNPLASIRSAVEQIALPDIGPEDTAVLQQLVVRESSRLSRLLAEFIDFARVKVTAPAPVEFRSLVSNVVALVRPHPDAARREIHLALPDDEEPIWVRGSEDLLHRAVLNLALNAVQWAGPEGKVWITVDCARSDILSPVLGALDVVRLRVVDSGPGIDPADTDHIFNPFFTRRQGGTGLGLALVQRAAEAHRGVVFVDPGSPGAGGAAFTLCLPTLGAAQIVEEYRQASGEVET